MHTAHFHHGTCMWVRSNDDIMFLPASHVEIGNVLQVIVDGKYVDGSVVTSVKPELKQIMVRAIHIGFNDPQSDFIFVQKEGHVLYPNNPHWLCDAELKGNKEAKMKSKETILFTVEKCNSSTKALGCLYGNIHFY